jgi:hypothetical protein
VRLVIWHDKSITEMIRIKPISKKNLAGQGHYDTQGKLVLPLASEWF